MTLGVDVVETRSSSGACAQSAPFVKGSNKIGDSCDKNQSAGLVRGFDQSTITYE